MSEHQGPWLAYFTRTDDQTLLRPGDEVEVYNSRLMGGRFTDAAVNVAMARLKSWRPYPHDPQGSRPVIIVHCGRLHVVMACTLTNTPPAPPAIVTAPAKPAKQMALF